jgi:site-specific DNA-methyltransferase (adenine-specific)
MEKQKTKNNRTIVLSNEEIEKYSKKLFIPIDSISIEEIENKTIKADLFEVIEKLPEKFVDLMIVDPPYNLYRKFNTVKFNEMSINEYSDWLDSWLKKLI